MSARMRMLAAAMAAAAVLAGCASGPDEAEKARREAVETQAVVTAPNTPAGRLLAAVNEARLKEHLRPLVDDPRLDRAASRLATDMADHDFFGHKGSDGSDFVQRVRHEGYVYRFIGESIAAGLASPKATVASWLASPDHRRNVLAKEAVQAGVGYAYRPDDSGKADYRYYWVLTVGCDADTDDRGGGHGCSGEPQKSAR